jgi:hypothetical protein
MNDDICWTNLWLECAFLLLVQSFTNVNLISCKLKINIVQIS